MIKWKRGCLWAALFLLWRRLPGQAEAAGEKNETDWAIQAVSGTDTGGYDGAGVKIALLDTGMRRTHEIFAGANIHEGQTYLEDGRSAGKDFIGHGTFLTSILAAVPGNSWGIQGIAPEAELIPLQCFDGRRGDASLLAEAVYDAVNRYECDIIHMSWGMPEPNEKLKKAVEYAAEKNVIMVASCGNEGGESPYYPAYWPEVIGVGAVDQSLKPAEYSQRNEGVFLMAPGSRIYGAGHTSDRAAVYRSGTSYAAAYVTGAAALALQADPELTPERIAVLLAETAEDLGEKGYDTATGYGLLNIRKFLDRIIFES